MAVQKAHAPERISQQATAGPDEADLRLDLAASRLFGDFSRARLQKWIRGGELTVDGVQRKPTHRVAAGEVLRISALSDREDVVVPQDIPLHVLYEDDDLLVLDKPSGLVVHPAAGNRDGTLQNALLHYDSSLTAIPRSGIVHRLDKDTSGVMVVARSLRAHTSLVKQLQSRSMSRVYEAVAAGDVRRAGTVDEPIGRHPRDRKRMAVVGGGRPAVTHYRIIQAFRGFTHLEVSLQTGRTHQIRVHLSHLGFPLVGDPVYGGKPRSPKGVNADLLAAVKAFPRQALHARSLRLLHPGDGSERAYHAPLPADMVELLAVLREHAV